MAIMYNYPICDIVFVIVIVSIVKTSRPRIIRVIVYIMLDTMVPATISAR